MEAGGLVTEANWNSFDPTMMPVEESEVMALLLGSNDQDHELSMAVQSVYWSDHNSDSYYSSKNCTPCYWSQGDSSATSSISYLHILNGHEGSYFHDADADVAAPMNFLLADGQPLPVILMNDEVSGDEARGSMENLPAPLLPSDHCYEAMKRRLHEADIGKPADNGQLGSSKKSRIIAAPVPKKGKNAESKGRQKSTAAVSNEAESNADTNAPSCSSCSSEDDSGSSPEPNGGTTSASSKGFGSLIQNGKIRAYRGSATDSQTLYARKRRERINERLRILQNLIPNGTKVDISTMLEEAFQYVKFLQIQIKLLSSDDMWMYAPIACNGMNLGIL